MAISKNGVKKYWDQRSLRQGPLATGEGTDMLIQEMQHVDRSLFIQPHIRTDLKTLDYGCGLGRFSLMFLNYIGCDITQSFLDYAKSTKPQKTFIKIEVGEVPNVDFEVFFTCTVLQHNSDEMVWEIFKKLPKGIFLYLYENNEPGTSLHVKGRSPQDYFQLLLDAKHDPVLHDSREHTIHGEKHTLSIFSI